MDEAKSATTVKTSLKTGP